MQILSTILGYVMRLCYQLLGNYALAIILFTIITKIILLPVSVWVQKNGIKMVRMQPEINRIKTNFFGFNDKISDETMALYKREKYNALAGLVPTVVQLVLIIGLVGVIYNPLTHLFQIDNNLIQAFIQLTGELTGADTASSSIQMAVITAVQNPIYQNYFLDLQTSFPNLNIFEIIQNLQSFKMNLFGLSLAIVPIVNLGVSLLMPVSAGCSAWLLCVCQNHLNPLQAEQGKLSQYGMMAFSVGISLCLGTFVPLGVGFYWIWSNLLSIMIQLVLNHFIDPHKYIDYAALEQSKKALAELENIGEKRKIFSNDPVLRQEKADYIRFFSIVNKHLVFYSEGSGYYKYFKDIIEYVLAHSNITIHYITSAPDDPIFRLAQTEHRIKPYYIGEKRLITLMMKLDTDIMVMTTPDLENYYLKRSYTRKDIEYIYTDHAISSNNLTLRHGALFHYDTIFCVGPYQIEEYRREEEVYKLSSRNLIETGYTLLDNMCSSYAKSKKEENAVKTILIAPSWQEDNLMDSCLDALIAGLEQKNYRIIIRPHPQYVRIYKARLESILNKYSSRFNNNFIIETDFSSNVTVYTADLVITDWSNIGYEFSFTTHRPTLYINTKMKVMNPDWENLEIEPFNIRMRNQIGVSLDPENLDKLGATVEDLLNRTSEFYDIIEKLKQENFFSLGKAAERSGRYILDRLQEKAAKRKSEK